MCSTYEHRGFTSSCVQVRPDGAYTGFCKELLVVASDTDDAANWEKLVKNHKASDAVAKEGRYAASLPKFNGHRLPLQYIFVTRTLGGVSFPDGVPQGYGRNAPVKFVRIYPQKWDNLELKAGMSRGYAMRVALWGTEWPRGGPARNSKLPYSGDGSLLRR